MSKSNRVWIGRRVTRSVYHTDTDCHHIPSDARLVDRAAAEDLQEANVLVKLSDVAIEAGAMPEEVAPATS